ncbi:exopolysaccharide biosynthesis polyprenyl glycosylphosphotransferase [Jannaschia sp. LMIT008]|uniref:exopolysaccharide biosynthesis polyprenyl glycosylphosphotransferase n=1 Tax=Jannaschia maritima TaxID=3032585 RepID=UPI002811D9CB|nr:exopolysaccharide biosynthesis polyprenyl glycosylphosphotransferase [Jannaschia sp. LMIT008]
MSDLSDTLSPTARHLAGRYRRASMSMPLVALVLGASDGVLLGLVHWFAFYAATPGAAFGAWAAAAFAAGLGAVGVATTVLFRAYDRGRIGRVGRGTLILLAASLGPALMAAVLRPMDLDAARFLAVAGLGTVMLPIPVRAVIAKIMRWADESGLMERRAVLVGGGDGARRVIEGLDRAGGTRVCAIFDDRSGDRSPDLVLDVPRIGRFDDLVGFARAAEIDLVIVTLDVSAQERIGQLLETFAVLPVPVHLSAFSESFDFAPGGLISLSDGTFGARTRLRKRAFDLAFGTLALILAMPVMALAAVAVKLDSPGPILFRQWRAGFSDRPIRVLKFRSMREEAADPDGRAVVTRGDARVTRVGAFLRRTSIDELPQLFNVLRGELSLVGPRPHAVDARSAAQDSFDAMVKGYSRRHRLPPGITGWAQIHGLRGTVEDASHLRARVDHDLWYIENWSPWLDLKILLMTPGSLVMRRENAF